MLNILFLISLFVVFPLGEVTRYQFNNGVAISLFDIVAVINLLTVTFILIKQKTLLSFTLTKPLGIFVFLCVVSLVVNAFVLPPASLVVAAMYIIRFLAYVSFYPTVYFISPNMRKRTPIYIVIAGIFVGIMGITQFFLYPTLQNLYYLGWDTHWYRLFATFFDPNFAGVVLLFPFFYSLFLAYMSLIKKNVRASVFFCLTTLFFLVSVYLTFSRTALLALAAGLIVFFYLLKIPRIIIAGMFALLVAGVIIVSINYKATEGTKLYRIASSTARIDSVNAALVIFSKNPILGIGFNAYRYAQYRYGFATGPNWQDSHSGAGTDNSFLFILAATGILGFASFLYLVFRIGMLYKTKNTHVPPVAASFVGVMIGSLFINAFFYPAILFLLWSSLGLIENTKH
ncbi:MAG: O-antigen ligase family protein [Patescibacteria group bacterium]|nr:O-antigen ligase family protein [Patescibacteria group bacterium]